MSGRNNFDEMRYEYFRDATVAIEAFKADQVDWRTENSAKNWATAYDFPAVTEKRVIQEEFANRSSGVMQAFVPNLRRDQVQGSASASRAELCLRLRGDEQADLLRSVRAGQQLFRWHRRAHCYRACRRARSSRSSRLCATRCRLKCSRRPTPIRSAAIRKPCATIFARRCACSRRPATRCATASWSTSRPVRSSPWSC